MQRQLIINIRTNKELNIWSEKGCDRKGWFHRFSSQTETRDLWNFNKKADSAKTKKDVSKKSEPSGVNKIYLI